MSAIRSLPHNTLITIRRHGYFWLGELAAKGITVRHEQPTLCAMAAQLASLWHEQHEIALAASLGPDRGGEAGGA